MAIKIQKKKTKDRVGLAIAALQISAFIYILVGTAFLAAALGGVGTFPPFAGFFMFFFCLALAAALEFVISGLKRRKYWAWLTGLIILGIYIPSLFLPLGIVGLIGLLDQGSVEACRKPTA